MANNGHRWTNAELREVMNLWLAEADVDEIAAKFGCTRFAINKLIGRMRRDGIPLPRRKAGHKAGRRSALWTQAEVEYLIRRRNDKATAEQIASELDRTFLGVQGMVQRLRREDVPIKMFGSGMRKLWDPEALKSSIAGKGLGDEDADIIPIKRYRST